MLPRRSEPWIDGLFAPWILRRVVTMTMRTWRVDHSAERRAIDRRFIDIRQRPLGVWIALAQRRRIAG
jgi:hypothetical protein